MPLRIIRDDITRLAVDAIVNAANETLLGGGGVDGAIHKAAGPRLTEACARLGGCPTGEARLTRGYDLPAKYVIHTVGPVWQGGDRGEKALLASCYRESLALALQRHCRTVAFPLISAGAYGCPRELALSVAMREIGDFLLTHEMDVTLVVYDRTSFQVSQKLLSDIREYIDETYVFAHRLDQRENRRPVSLPMAQGLSSGDASTAFESCAAPMTDFLGAPSAAAPKQARRRPGSLEEAMQQLDESFTEMLLRKIDEKGITDVQCYKRANVDRKLFSKIRKDRRYKPSKPTAVAFAIALELSLQETRELLMKAGFALSHSNKFDIIIEYFIQRRNYDIYEINEALFAFDQVLLGC